MKTIVKNITYIDDGINIPIQLPEELIGSLLFVEIKKETIYLLLVYLGKK
ncbi:hypothetical protein [Peribacillus sp. TH24]|nr:hypothetical protein [Peribacillus sp. TH24]MBK5444689.1 hypothetical protein [Peribacillus sp. TH24]